MSFEPSIEQSLSSDTYGGRTGFRKGGIFLTVDEKLLKCSLFHYLGNEWKITDWTEIFVDQIKSRFFQ